ncbi:UbiH/UbiF family hydroxylase [Roseisalinus antarcticus]|uniref:2-octaprenylphenol hydroxylase n=1 Tax=Roseisalinus antarcticus TaxID=254357 RepID=A0A1Y5TLZ2_9RHOB|nr:UbiH/UbiF family hydroxylase [Roseisalinus antarcticus]SLN66703.1 2-octaprenylphenol hydroxylase [Roseisalinus antarcticus]
MDMDCDIFISGGGVAGLTAAAAFGAAGFRVVCADPAPPVTEALAEGADLRTTAFLQPARTLLEEAGIWPHLAPHATPLRIMRIVDAGGAEPEARVTRDFDSADIGPEPFGWNLPNWLLRREILCHIDELGTVDFRPGTGFRSMLTRESEARVVLSDGSRLRTRLVIGADGRDSPVREAAGIDARTYRYGQKAVTCAMTHNAPHDNISTEIHRTGGPFTLVPLPDHEGRPCSALVWMAPGAEVQRLIALPDAAFEAEATERSAGLYGPLSLVTRRTTWPIISRVAGRMSAERTALMAEAAHVMPPIGAQGLNTSLADLACLLGLVRAAPEALGTRAMLDRYHRRRHPDVLLRVQGIDALNRASMASAPALRDLRAAGIEALHGMAPVRRGLMRLGLGAR